jgi:putative nucleotidyltransferase with HDIG domain
LYIAAHNINTGNVISNFSKRKYKELELDINGIAPQDLAIAGTYHDIGKYPIPPETRDTKKELPEDIKDIIKIHPSYGSLILKEAGLNENVVKTVHYHHERWDGKGYPEGLSMYEIPLGSRILRPVDTFQKLQYPRPYRHKQNMRGIKHLLKRNSGPDPTLSEVLKRQISLPESLSTA